MGPTNTLCAQAAMHHFIPQTARGVWGRVGYPTLPYPKCRIVGVLA